MRAIGIDISKWQRGYNPAVKRHDYIILKASEAGGKDLRFEQHYSSAEGKLTVGAYHFYRSHTEWKRQADFFLETIYRKQIMMVALDMEGSQVYKNGFGIGAEKWMEYIRANTTANRTLAYIGRAAHQYLVQVGNDWLMEYDLWLAQYPFDKKWDDYLLKAYTGEAHPAMPAGRTDWAFWQFSAGGNKKGKENGIVGYGLPAVDLDVFNGTREEFGKWLRGEQEEVPKPIPAPPEAPAPVEQPYVLVSGRNEILDEVVAAVEALR